MWFYMSHIAPRQLAMQRGEPEIHSSLSDLYSPWRGTQELLLHHRDPYSAPVTRDIQVGYYGRALDGSPGGPRDQQRFAYPVYVAFLLSPAMNLSFDTVRSLARWGLLGITLASVPLWMRLVGERISLLSLIAAALLTVGSVPAMEGFNLQQLALLVAGLLAGSAALLARGRYIPAGVFLALASIKPQISSLVTAWLILWAVSDWRKRRGFLWGWLGTMAVLVLAGVWILPAWIIEFGRGLVAYAAYTDSSSWLELWLPRWLAVVVAGLAGLWVLTVAWRTRRVASDSVGFAFAFALILTVTIAVVPGTKPTYNQVLLLPGLLLAASRAGAAWKEHWLSRAGMVFWWCVVIAPWILAAGVVAVWLISPEAVRRVWAAPVYVALLLPLGGFGLLMVMRKECLEC